MSRRSIIRNLLLSSQTEDCDIVLVVKHYELVGTKLYLAYRRPSWRVECDTDSSLAEDIYEAWPELGLIGTDSEEGLYGIVGKGGNLGVDAIAGELHIWVSGGLQRRRRVGAHIV